jgi:molecular chaperone HscB
LKFEIWAMNYFELFEIPISIKVDKKLLSKKYVELQKKYHPDFYTQSTEDEQGDALEKSSAINKALKIFKNEDETIKYVLQLKGLLEEEEKYALPPAFLMEMIELNESLEEEDASSKTQASKYIDELYKDIADIIKNYDDASITKEDLLKLKEYYYKKKYLQRILDRIDG